MQVVKNAAALAILPDYYELCKYNLRRLKTAHDEAHEVKKERERGAFLAVKTEGPKSLAPDSADAEDKE